MAAVVEFCSFISQSKPKGCCKLSIAARLTRAARGAAPYNSFSFYELKTTGLQSFHIID